MAFEGMMVEQVQQFGQKLAQQVQGYEQQLNALGQEAISLDWKGPDRERMMQEMQALVRQACNVFQQLEQKAQEFVTQAQQQEQASQA